MRPNQTNKDATWLPDSNLIPHLMKVNIPFNVNIFIHDALLKQWDFPHSWSEPDPLTVPTWHFINMLKKSSPGSWGSPSGRRCPITTWLLLCVILSPGRPPTLARWSSNLRLWELAIKSKNSSVCGDVMSDAWAVKEGTKGGIPLKKMRRHHQSENNSSVF